MDFYKSTKQLNVEKLEKYLSGKIFPITYDLKYIYNSRKTAKKYSRDDNIINYNYLGYDSYGGINLPKNNFNINAVRWKGNSISEFPIDTNQYNYLDSISKHCFDNAISLTFVQTPLRENYYSAITKNEKDSIHCHIKQAEAIILRYQHTFINCTKKSWNDSLFIDYSHFSNEGTKLFTQYFINEMISH